MTTPIVFLDTETDGVHPGRKVWEVAMIRRDDTGERETSFYVEIDLSTADPFGLRVGRFYDRHPLGRFLSGIDASLSGPGLSAARAAHSIARVTHGAHIVGMVPNFDTEVLGNLLRAEGLTPAGHYHLQDVENLAVGYFARCKHDAELFVAYATGDEERARHAADVERYAALSRPPYDSETLSRALGVEPPGDDERHTALGDARWAMRLYDKITGGATA